jgi:hypothetical protein
LRAEVDRDAIVVGETALAFDGGQFAALLPLVSVAASLTQCQANRRCPLLLVQPEYLDVPTT